MAASQRVLVVGAGISGLATAYHLVRRRPGLGVTVLEAAERPGGTAWTERRDGYLLEMGPNGFLDNKDSTLSLCRRLGLAPCLARVELASVDRYLYLRGRLRRVPNSPEEFLRARLVSWRGRARALGERLVPPRDPATDESIADFGRRRLGREVTESILDAVATGIFAGDSELLSLPACFPRLAYWEKRHGGLIRAQFALARKRRARGEPRPATALLAPDGGMRTLIEALARSLGDRLRFGVRALALAPLPQGGWRLETDAEKSHEADVVVLACPAYRQKHILTELDPPLALEAGSIEYAAAAVVACAFRRDDLPPIPRGVGYLTPQRLERPVLGVQWSTMVHPHQAPPDQHLFRAMLGGWRRRDVVDWDDPKLFACVRAELAETLGIRAEPTLEWLCRWPRAIPQYHVGHLARLQRMTGLLEPHRGLFLTGNAYRGVAINDCAQDALRTTHGVLAYLDGAFSPRKS